MGSNVITSLPDRDRILHCAKILEKYATTGEIHHSDIKNMETELKDILDICIVLGMTNIQAGIKAMFL